MLHRFDGFTWTRLHGSPAEREEAPDVAFAGPEYSYDVTLEPNSHGVLIGLDLPRELPRDLEKAFRSFDYQLMAGEPANSAISYQLSILAASSRHRRTCPTHCDAWTCGCRAGRNPRTLELARTLRAAARDDRGFVQAVLDYLQRQWLRVHTDAAETRPQLGR